MDANHSICEALFYIMAMNIEKLKFKKKNQCQTKQLEIYSKKRLINCIVLYRLIPTQKKLNHSTPNNEVD